MGKMNTRIRLALLHSHPIDARMADQLMENPDGMQDLLRSYARAGFALMQGGASSAVAALLASDEEEICRVLALVLANPSMRTKALNREIRRHFFEDENGLVRPSRRLVRESAQEAGEGFVSEGEGDRPSAALSSQRTEPIQSRAPSKRSPAPSTPSPAKPSHIARVREPDAASDIVENDGDPLSIDDDEVKDPMMMLSMVLDQN